MDTPGPKRRRLSESLIQCCVCLDAPRSPVQCSNGHLLCADCARALPSDSCPSCRTSLDRARPIRCLLAEQLLEASRPSGCDGAGLGCGWSGARADKEEHERTCVAARARMRFNAVEAELGAKRTEGMALDARLERLERGGGGYGAGGAAGLLPVVAVGASWGLCIQSFVKEPPSGCSVLVRPRLVRGLARDTPVADVWCSLPGVSFLKGAQLYFTAEYRPDAMAASRIVCVSLDETLGPVGPISLRALLLWMQKWIVALPVGVADADAERHQRRTRLKALDAPTPPAPAEYVRPEAADWEQAVAFASPGCEGRQEKACLLMGVDTPPSKLVRFDNLAYRVSETELKEELGKRGYGVAQVRIPRHPSHKWKTQGFAEVTMQSYGEAARLVEENRSMSFYGRTASIKAV